MYRSIRIERFRGFRDLELRDLAPVNLILGPNGVGKTACLEAIFLHCGATNPQLALELSGYRGIKFAYAYPPTGQAPWETLFADFDRTTTIQITGTSTDGASRVVRLSALTEKPQAAANDGESGGSGIATTQSGLWGIRLESSGDSSRAGTFNAVLGPKGIKTDVNPSAPFPTLFVFSSRGIGADSVERFSRLRIARASQPVIDAMRIIEPRITDISIQAHSSPGLWADVGLPELLPLEMLGDGVGRVLNITCAIASCPNGVVLVDEAEAGIYHEVHLNLWRAIITLAERLQVQLFLTTHSHEFLAAAHAAAHEFAFPVLKVHRLERDGADVDAVSYDDDSLDAAMAGNIEVR